MSYYRLFYHFVWATKHREPLITDANVQPIYACIVDKVAEFKGIVHAVHGMSDHVHLVATVPPTVAISRFIGQVKGSSSHLASRLREGDYEEFAWQDEYGVLSISENHLPVVIRYVERQREHHAQGRLNETLERCEFELRIVRR